MLADRVKETSTTTGTGTLDLDGPVSKFVGFVSAIGTTNSCHYAIVHQTAAEWEVGIGVVTDATPDTLSRDTVLASSNAGALVSFTAGTMDVFVDSPADILDGTVKRSYTQAAHGFAAGDVINMSGSTWGQAQADTAINAEAEGVVESVTTDTFVVVFHGRIKLTGLTAGDLHYLSAGVAGDTVTTAPSIVGQIRRPIFKAITSTEAVVNILLGLEVSSASSVIFGQNVVLNPEMNVLSGTHTSAIQQNNVASNTQNHEILGWRSVTGIGSPDITVSGDTTVGTFVSGAKRSMKIAVASLGTTDPVLEMPLIEGEAPAIDTILYGLRNRVLNFSADVKQSTATANACRLAITTDGTGGTTTYGAYHVADTTLERLFASATIPADATFIKLRLSIEHATPDYNISKPMALPSAIALTSLDFESRLSFSILSQDIDNPSNDWQWSTANTTAHDFGDGTGSPDTNPNDVRPAFASVLIMSMYWQPQTATASGYHVNPAGNTDGAAHRLAIANNNGLRQGQEITVQLGEDGTITIKSTSATNPNFMSAMFQAWRGDGL